MQITDAMVAKACAAYRDSAKDGSNPTLTEMRAALDAALAAMWRQGEVKSHISSACLSYRHDYGLLSPDEQERLRFEAREWLNAWRKEFSPLPSPPVKE